MALTPEKLERKQNIGVLPTSQQLLTDGLDT